MRHIPIKEDSKTYRSQKSRCIPTLTDSIKNAPKKEDLSIQVTVLLQVLQGENHRYGKGPLALDAQMSSVTFLESIYKICFWCSHFNHKTNYISYREGTLTYMNK